MSLCTSLFAILRCMRTTFRSLRPAGFFLTVALACAASGCGLKGPLYRPGDPSHKSAPASGESQTTTQKKDRTNETRKAEPASAPSATPPAPTQDPSSTQPDR